MGDAVLQVAFLTSFAAFPWVVKPLYGFLSDTLPIFGYRRRSYLIICGLLGIMTLLCFGLHAQCPNLSCLCQCRGVCLRSTHKTLIGLCSALQPPCTIAQGDYRHGWCEQDGLSQDMLFVSS